MIILDCEQYSDEWWKGRLGIPTASVMGKIVTSAGKKSESSATILNKFVAERLRGKPDEGFKSDWMERGHKVEPEARDMYEFLTDYTIKIVGLCYRDDRRDVGLSPDALIQSNNEYIGGLEIKCPSPGVHVGYLLGGKVPTEYKPQVFSSLYLSGLGFWDFMSYHPDLAPFRIRTTPESKEYQTYASALDKYLPEFIGELERRVNQLSDGT